MELPDIARRLARGDTTALAAVDGSRVVIAVRSDDVLVAGDLAGQCPVFYGSFNGQVVVGSHAGKLAKFVGRSLNHEWLAARLLLPSVSDVWWTETPWRGVRAVRPGWLLRISTEGKATTRQWLNLGVPDAGLVSGGHALRAALQRAVAARVAAAEFPTVDLSGGLVPASIIDRRTKGDYTALSYRGLHRNADALDDLLASSRLDALGLIDAQAVRAELGKGAQGVPIRLGAFDTVIGVELWLRSTEIGAQGTPIATGGSRALPT